MLSSLPAASRCESRSNALHLCVAYCTVSADETTSTPSPLTISTVPASTHDTRGSPPSREYSMATTPAPRSSSRSRSIICDRLTHSSVSSPSRPKRP